MKLGNFKTPTGATGNIFSFGSWLELIIGAAIMFITVATGQKLVQMIPANKVLDTAIEPITAQPAAAGSKLTMI